MKRFQDNVAVKQTNAWMNGERNKDSKEKEKKKKNGKEEKGERENGTGIEGDCFYSICMNE